MGERRIRPAALVSALVVITALAGFAAADGGAAQQNAQRVHSEDRWLGVTAVGSGARAGQEVRLVVMTGDGP